MQHTVVLACGDQPPQTLREWRDRASLIILVRIDSQVAFEHDGGSNLGHVITAHEATVLEVFKGHPRAVVEGASQQVLQFGGTIRRPDVIRKQTWNGFPPMTVGTEWVLFLEWNQKLDGFTPVMIDKGAAQLLDAKVAMQASPEWNGRPEDEFFQALRAAR